MKVINGQHDTLRMEVLFNVHSHVWDMDNNKFRLPAPHQEQTAKMTESSLALCGSGILPLVTCRSAIRNSMRTC